MHLAGSPPGWAAGCHWVARQPRKEAEKDDGRLAVASGVSSRENKTERKTPGCRGT